MFDTDKASTETLKFYLARLLFSDQFSITKFQETIQWSQTADRAGIQRAINKAHKTVSQSDRDAAQTEVLQHAKRSPTQHNP